VMPGGGTRVGELTGTIASALHECCQLRHLAHRERRRHREQPERRGRSLSRAPTTSGGTRSSSSCAEREVLEGAAKTRAGGCREHEPMPFVTIDSTVSQ